MWFSINNFLKNAANLKANIPIVNGDELFFRTLVTDSDAACQSHDEKQKQRYFITGLSKAIFVRAQKIWPLNAGAGHLPSKNPSQFV